MRYGYVWDKHRDPLWWGLFLTEPINGTLECAPHFGQHITFGYKDPIAGMENDIPWSCDIPITVIGYANDGKNEGLFCALPDDIMCLYHSEAPPHITLSFSTDSKPAYTGRMKFEMIDEPYTISGRFGTFKGNQVRF